MHTVNLNLRPEPPPVRDKDSIAGGQKGQLRVYADRVLLDDLAVNLHMGSNYRVIPTPKYSLQTTATIKAGESSTVVEVLSRDPWDTLPGRTPRRYCSAGNIHATILEPDKPGAYIYDNLFVWLDVYKSDEYADCN